MGTNRIVDHALYGEHIPLKCKNHSDKRWSTKNIGFIGYRTVFYNLYNVYGMGPECDCKPGCLIPLTAKEARGETSARVRSRARTLARAREEEERKKNE